jgi:arabinofuranosyltransferase
MTEHPTPPLLQRVGFWGALTLALGLLIAHACWFDFINDDAFISFRYAANLVNHGELTWNPGEQPWVEGYTNFLWTMVMAAVIALGGDPVPWSKGLGVALSCVTLGALAGWGRRWHLRQRGEDGPRWAPPWAALAPLLLALSPAFAAWTEGGLETALFTTLTTVGWLAYLRELEAPERVGWSGVAVALAAMTRPEGMLVLAALAGHRALWQVTVERCWRPSRHLLTLLGLFALVFAPWFAWRWSIYGWPFPNTYYAKAGSPLWEPGWRYTWGFLTESHAWVLLPLIVLPWRRSPGGGALLALIALLALPWGLHVTRVGGDFMALHRFYVPLLPLLAFGVQEGAANLWTALREAAERQAERPLGRSLQLRAAAVGLALLLALAGSNARLTQRSLEVSSADGVDSIGWLKMFVEQTAAIGRYLQSAYPPDTSLATTAAGVIPYYSNMKTLDLLALNDAWTAHNVEGHSRRPGHSKSAPEPYVLQWAPDLLIWHPRIAPQQPRPAGHEERYWRERGYRFRYAQVPGLQPPFWSYYERTAPPPAR